MLVRKTQDTLDIAALKLITMGQGKDLDPRNFNLDFLETIASDPDRILLNLFLEVNITVCIFYIDCSVCTFIILSERSLYPYRSNSTTLWDCERQPWLS